ncbi:MAG: hypothetical protein EHM87_24055 [Burkholderiales bacterium]|nr:MAG: hypothetical protein EHM87_24055 [Burkholderiales bacterium]
MRSIIQKEKSRRTNQIALGIILAIVMFISVLGYSFQGGNTTDSEKVVYNGFEFTSQNGLWFLEMGNIQFSFLYNPHQTERIGTNINYLDSYSGKPLYVYSENREAESEIYRNLFYQNRIVQRIQYACLNEDECKGNFPIKTCSDNFILIKESNQSRITQNENCISIEGPEEELTKLTDEFLFKILKVD